MNREQRLEAIAVTPADRLVALADRVLETMPVIINRGPTVGLLMVRVEELAERLAFNFIEVTVTEAEVASGEHRGYAMIMGRAPEAALAGAVIDVALEAGHPLAGEVVDVLVSAVAAEEAAWQARWAEVAPSVVTFEEAV